MTYIFLTVERNPRQHQAPEILSDSGSEKESQHRRSNDIESAKGSTKNKVTQADHDEHTDVDGSDQDSAENEDEDQDDGLTDLHGLNHDALKKTFVSEVRDLLF